MKEPHLRIEYFDFNSSLFGKLKENAFARDMWPVVYILSNGTSREAYIGETTDTLSRMAAHTRHDAKSRLTSVRLITSENFHKSATLDIESNLIRYVAADGQYTLLNGNLGIAYHNYYQKNEVYWQLFRNLWDKLRAEGLAKHSLEHIDNSDLFKYSPYKALTNEQADSLIVMLQAIADPESKHILIEGGAGTGKTILAIFLFKLLSGKLDDMSFRDFGEREHEVVRFLNIISADRPSLKMALVVPMASFRTTLQNVFKNIKGLSASMVTGPAEITRDKYDIIVVDESHRLRRRVNLGTYFSSFDNACKKLGLNPNTASELDWASSQASKTLLFYDAGQSIKPSDVPKEQFDAIKSMKNTRVQTLTSQFRVKGGNSYVDFIDKLFQGSLDIKKSPYTFRDYEVCLFKSAKEMVEEIKMQEEKLGLARLIGGYAWEWKSKKDPNAWDIEIEEIQLRWNNTNINWIHSTGAVNEVGCIHTTQGYDLNYAGIIIGPEISWNEADRKIVIHPEKYFDKNGKQSIRNQSELERYIINIYKTILLRAIRGTYIYVCDPTLRNYMSQFLPVRNTNVQRELILDIFEHESSNRNVPYYNLQVAAGTFSDLQLADVVQWVRLPDHITQSEDLFACQVIGASMDRIIPPGSICLFRRYQGGSRQGRIVLAELTHYVDAEFGSRYTIKEYESHKYEDESGWQHTTIRLKPRSTDPSFQPIELHDEETDQCRIIAWFECVLEG